MYKEVDIKDVFDKGLPLIDVRSPGEFAKGHIPGAKNIPLFSNDERAHVGTVYKQQSKDAAYELGLEYVKPKLQSFIDESLEHAPEKEAIVHCWRGGMRSRSFAQHLLDNGFKKAYVIIGGYKSFRNFVLNYFEQDFDLKVVGGFTGSGKTYILKEIQKLGKQVIDLEGLAHHKGSAFGMIGEPSQPSVEHFENVLFNELRQLDHMKAIYIEDESHSIGNVRIPMGIYTQIRNVQMYFIDIPKEERARHLVSEYGQGNDMALAASLQKIAKRFGNQNLQEGLQFLKEKKYFELAMLTLNYYDKGYLRGAGRRDQDKITRIPLKGIHHKENAQHIIDYIESNGRN